MIRVTPISTGKAWLKSAQKCAGEGRNPFQRKIDIFRDKKWMCLEIFAWLIEHPEGRFIVDTGDSSENSTPGYLPWWNLCLGKTSDSESVAPDRAGPAHPASPVAIAVEIPRARARYDWGDSEMLLFALEKQPIEQQQDHGTDD